MNRNFLQNNEIVRTKGPVAAGTSDITDATIVDHQGFSNITHVVMLGTLTATQVTGVKVQYGDVSDGSDFTDATGLSYAPTDGNDDVYVALELIKPVKRYSRVYIDRATANAVIEGAFAIKSNPRVAPITQGATVASAKQAAV